jgi:hypothetical protein
VAILPGIPYQPVALVGRLQDGQLVVLHGQAEVADLSYDEERGDYRSTIVWRRGREFTQLRMTDAIGVQVRADGDQFQVSPVLADPTEESLEIEHLRKKNLQQGQRLAELDVALADQRRACTCRLEGDLR